MADNGLMKEEFSREISLIGEENLEKLNESTVMIFGLGGVGSYAAEALARAGIGKLILVDSDDVDITNINRQLYALHSTLGIKKVEIAAERIRDINPGCKTQTIAAFYDAGDGEKFFTDNCTYVVDAIDTVSAKIDIALECQSRNIPLISCMGTGNKLHPELFEISDIYKTSVCPLCRVMRRELKNRGVKKLKVVYSREQPKSSSQKSRVPASISFTPPVAGFLLAAEVVKDICQIE